MDGFAIMWTPTDIAVHALMFISLYFEVFLLITFLERRPDREPRIAPKRFPTATIVVPCFNEERSLGKTVDSLMALEYPKDRLTVSLIDDGSTDSTWNVMQALQAKYPSVAIYHKENGGKHTALNFAIEHSDSEIIGCLDSDSTVASDALLEIVSAFENTTAMAVIPAIKVVEPTTWLQMVQRAEYNLSIFVRKIFSSLDANFVTPGPFSFFRREVFETLGLYAHAHNTEDMEMAMRMQYHNMKITNANHAYVYTITPPTLRKLVRQRVRWTYGFIRNFFDYKDRLVFKRAYGNIGMFILPITMFAIFSALALTAVALASAARFSVEQFEKIQTIGIDTPTFAFDWFYINTQSMIILTVVILLITSTLMMLGRAIAGEKVAPTRDMLVYFLAYGFIAPIWLFQSVYRAALDRPTSWTNERSR